MRAHELGIYDAEEDRLYQTALRKMDKPRLKSQHTNKKAHIQHAQDRQRRLDQETITLMFGDLEAERAEIELGKDRAELQKARHEIEQTRLQVELVRAEIIATLAGAQKAQAEAEAADARNNNS